MHEHVHTGFSAFLFAGVSAIVLINLVRFAATHLVANDSTEAIGRSLGALVSFPAGTGG